MLTTKTIKTDLFQERKVTQATKENAIKILKDDLGAHNINKNTIIEVLSYYGGFWCCDDEVGHYGVDYRGYMSKPSDNPNFYKVIVKIENTQFAFNLNFTK